MNGDIFTLKKAIAASLREALVRLDLPDTPVALEAPKDPSHGDLATPLALTLARIVKRNPLELARELCGQARFPEQWIQKAEPAPPGFINLRIAPAALQEGLSFALAAGPDFGRNREASGLKVLLEFVSANPTGPLNVVSARAAALGDSMARLLKASGAAVECEYFINDAGVQARLFGESLLTACLRSRGVDASAPEGGYQGAYMDDLAREFLEDPAWKTRLSGEPSKDLAFELGAAGMERVIGWHRRSLEGYGVSFDRFFSERRELRDKGKVDECVAFLRSRGLTFEKDGALWLKVSEYGAPKDEVLVKSDGTPAYFAPDIAYHMDKFSRGYDRLVDIMGPDHHGHIQRMKSAMRAAGQPDDHLDILIAQQVNLLSAGEKFKMSKREGRFVSMDDLVAEVGKDAARFFFNMRGANAHLDFDLEVAKKQTDENPVYYVQYAHARICSLLRKAAEAGATPGREAALLGKLVEPEEFLLLKEILEYPEWVASSAKALEPHRIVTFLQKLAADFHVFYDHHRVLGAADGLDRARLALAEGVRLVIRNALDLLGVSAPERM